MAPSANSAIGVYGSVASGGTLYLLNQGVINGGSGYNNNKGLSGFGGGGGGGVELSGGTVSNSGNITGGTGGNGGFGVELSGGTLFNSGNITGGTGGYGNYGGFSGDGVELSGGTVSNSGTIIGGNGNIHDLNNGGAGVYLIGGTLFDSGRIEGGTNSGGTLADAVQFGTGVGTLVVEAGASFVGSVVANATLADVLAIAGTSSVTLTGLGTEFQNFHTLAFDPGSSGTFAGSLTGLNNDSIMGFERGDGFYVDGFAASGTLATIGAGGTLILTGASAGQTLDLTFAAAAIGDVLDLSTTTGGTSINIDPRYLNQSISTGITLTPTGTYQSPFTITSAGTIIASSGSSGVYGSVASGSLSLLNEGLIQGGGGSATDGVYLHSGTLTNSGTITGGSSSYGGNGVNLTYGILANSGTITGGNGSYRGGNGVNLLSGTFTNHGIITGGSGSNYGGNGVHLKSSTLTNSGTITGGNGGSSGVGVYIDAGTLIDSGKILGGTGVVAVLMYSLYTSNVSTLVVEAGASFVGGVVADPKVSDVLAIGGTSLVSLTGLGTEYQNFHTLAFDTGASGNVSGTYTAFSALNVTGFAQGDTLVLDGFAATSDTYVNGTGLELSNGTSTITIDVVGSFATTNFNVIDPPANTTISLNAPCFAAGTRILTPRGEIAVEQMQEGDQVILADGTRAPVVWIGYRSINIARHPNPESVLPVLIMADAIFDGVPRRDLLLSPDHAVFFDGHLIPAKTLINGVTIRQIDRRSVTYYHIELPEHAVLVAEGVACESYLETGNRDAFANGGQAMRLHPAFDTAPDWQAVREARSCAPFAEDGKVVEVVRAGLLVRAGIRTTADAGIAITRRADGSVIIASRCAIPGHLTPDPRDRRRLGVKIAALHREDGSAIPLDHPDLTQGWYDPQTDGRWTDGRAVIPAALAQGRMITFDLAATTRYRLPVSHRMRAATGTIGCAGEFGS